MHLVGKSAPVQKQTVRKQGQFLPHQEQKNGDARFASRSASVKGRVPLPAAKPASVPDYKSLEERRIRTLFNRQNKIQKKLPYAHNADKESYPDDPARANFKELISIRRELDVFRRSSLCTPNQRGKIAHHQQTIENALACNILNLKSREYNRSELVIELSQLLLDEPFLNPVKREVSLHNLEFALEMLAFSCQCPLDDDLLNSEDLSKMEKCRDIAEQYGFELESAAAFNLYHHLGIAYTRLQRDEEAAECFQKARGAFLDGNEGHHDGGAPFDARQALHLLECEQQGGNTQKKDGRLSQSTLAERGLDLSINQRLSKAYLACVLKELASEDHQAVIAGSDASLRTKRIQHYLSATVQLITVSALNGEPIDCSIRLLSNACRIIENLPSSNEKRMLKKELAAVFIRIAVHIRRSFSTDNEMGLLNTLLRDAPLECREELVNRQFQIHWHNKKIDCAHEVLKQLESQPSVHYYCNSSLLSMARRNYKDALEFLEEARGKIAPDNPRDIYVFHKRAAFLYKTVARTKYRDDLFPDKTKNEVFDEALCHASVALYYASKKDNLAELETLIDELKA